MAHQKHLHQCRKEKDTTMQKGEGKKMDLEIVTNCKNGGLTEEN